jgi:hypothetical protein
MNHTMKLWERVIEHRFSHESTISENQFDFMPRRSNMKAIFLLRRLIKIKKEACKDLHMEFFDL